MKHAFPLLAVMFLAGVALVAFGCQKKATSDAPLNESVTEVSAPSHPIEPTPAPQPPIAQQPVVEDSAQAQPEPSGTVAGGSYTIQKGDTFYSIARQRYGDGKQWQRIAAANPGVDPTKLRVGQTINVP